MNTDRDWECLAQLDPYHSVLTSSSADFFGSGEMHIARVFRHLGNFSPKVAIDFGCGVGRLLIPLASRAERVIGIDVSSTMLQEADSNLKKRGISNVALASSLDAITKADFVHSFLVFQHIPVKRGEQLLRSLLSRVTAGGFVAVHFPIWCDTPRWRKIVSGVAKNTVLGKLANVIHGRPLLYPRMQMNYYDATRLLLILKKGNFRDISIVLIDDDSSPQITGAIFYGQKT